MKEQNEVSIIKDVFTNTPHVIAVLSNETIKMRAVTEYGKSIINEYQLQNGYTTASVPDGFVKTDFKKLTPNMEKMFSAVFDEIGWNPQKVNELTTKAINYQKSKSFMSRNSNAPKSDSSRSPSSRSLFKFKNKINKINIVNYKAKIFKDNSKTSSLIEKIKSSELAFDSINNTIVGKNSNSFAQNKLESIIQDSKNARLLKRNFGEKNADFASMTKNYNRRTIRRATKISDDLLFDEPEQKELSGFQKFSATIKSKFKRKTGKIK